MLGHVPSIMRQHMSRIQCTIDIKGDYEIHDTRDSIRRIVYALQHNPTWTDIEVDVIRGVELAPVQDITLPELNEKHLMAPFKLVRNRKQVAISGLRENSLGRQLEQEMKADQSTPDLDAMLESARDYVDAMIGNTYDNLGIPTAEMQQVRALDDLLEDLEDANDEVDFEAFRTKRDEIVRQTSELVLLRQRAVLTTNFDGWKIPSLLQTLESAGDRLET